MAWDRRVAVAAAGWVLVRRRLLLVPVGTNSSLRLHGLLFLDRRRHHRDLVAVVDSEEVVDQAVAAVAVVDQTAAVEAAAAVEVEVVAGVAVGRSCLYWILK